MTWHSPAMPQPLLGSLPVLTGLGIAVRTGHCHRDRRRVCRKGPGPKGMCITRQQPTYDDVLESRSLHNCDAHSKPHGLCDLSLRFIHCLHLITKLTRQRQPHRPRRPPWSSWARRARSPSAPRRRPSSPTPPTGRRSTCASSRCRQGTKSKENLSDCNPDPVSAAVSRSSCRKRTAGSAPVCQL